MNVSGRRMLLYNWCRSKRLTGASVFLLYLFFQRKQADRPENREYSIRSVHSYLYLVLVSNLSWFDCDIFFRAAMIKPVPATRITEETKEEKMGRTPSRPSPSRPRHYPPRDRGYLPHVPPLPGPPLRCPLCAPRRPSLCFLVGGEWGGVFPPLGEVVLLVLVRPRRG